MIKLDRAHREQYARCLLILPYTGTFIWLLRI